MGPRGTGPPVPLDLGRSMDQACLPSIDHGLWCGGGDIAVAEGVEIKRIEAFAQLNLLLILRIVWRHRHGDGVTLQLCGASPQAVSASEPAVGSR